MTRRGKILAFIGVEYALTALCTMPLFLLDAEPLGAVLFTRLDRWPEMQCNK